MPLVEHRQELWCLSFASTTVIHSQSKVLFAVVSTVFLRGFCLWLDFRLRDVLSEIHRFLSRCLLFRLRRLHLNRLLPFGWDCVLVRVFNILREFLYHFLLVSCFLPFLRPNIRAESSKLVNTCRLLDPIEVFLSIGLVAYNLLPSLRGHKRRSCLTVHLSTTMRILLIFLCVCWVGLEAVCLWYVFHLLWCKLMIRSMM